MMKYLASRTFWGILLIAGGIAFLVQNIWSIALGDLFWTAALGLGAFAFLSVYFSDRRQWWAIIPGMALLSIAAVVLLNFVFPGLAGQWSGMVGMGGIGLAFFLIYWVERKHWWAIIPGGVMFTLAIVAGLANVLQELGSGGVFFLGLGLTFGLVAILPNPQGQMKWAFIPAGILIAMGLLMMAFSVKLINYVWPAAMILLGLYLVFRAFTARR